MSRKIQRMSSTLTMGENTAYINWIKQKDAQKLKEEQLEMYEVNKKKIENRIEQEKRRVLNEIYYWKWLEKKTNELKEKKLIQEENEKKRKEMEEFQKRNQMVKDMKFNEWLEKKLSEERMRKQQTLIEKQEKSSEIEMKKCEKEQAKYVWKLWLENKEKKIRDEKLKKEKEEEEKEKEKEEKRKLSEEKFKEWMNKANNRPRPVKNNLGFMKNKLIVGGQEILIEQKINQYKDKEGLSCSNIGYVNPEPWKNILDKKPNNDDNNENNISDYDKMFTILYKKPSDLKFNNSNTTMKTLDDSCDNSALKRTADWVKHSTQSALVMKQTKLNVNNKGNEQMMTNKVIILNKRNDRNNKNNIIKLDRNKSLPLLFNGHQRKNSNRNNNMCKK